MKAIARKLSILAETKNMKVPVSAATLVRVILLLVSMHALACADYLDPPDWSDSNDFTHQSWDFLTDESANLPAPPDGEPNAVNPFGTAGLIDIEYTTLFQFWLWYPDYLKVPTDRRGFYGGMGDTTVTFEIPNNERVGFWQKQLWLQVVYWARMDTLDNYDLRIARDSGLNDSNDIEIIYEELVDPNEDEGVIGKFYRLTTAARFEDQPSAEYIAFTAYQYPPDANHENGGASMIDQVHIDTRCVNLDLAEDGIINLRDFALFANLWQNHSAKTDFYPDSSNDENDLQVLLEYWLMQNGLP